MSPWSGLGINFTSLADPVANGLQLDDIIARVGLDIRIDIPTYGPAQLDWQTKAKASVIQAVAKGMRVVFGCSSNGITLTDSTWPAFHTAILEFAQWSQDNGVYEFQLGNEEELHNDDSTITDTEVVTLMKSTATEVQAIFTRGNVSYSVNADITSLNQWISAGRGDVDIVAYNSYSNYFYPSGAQALFTAFGADHCSITEFGPHYSALNSFSTDEEKQTVRVREMIEKFRSIGIPKYYYFSYRTPGSNDFGAAYLDGSHRLLWNSLTSKRSYFINI